ncbi:unnamed protein product, partial [Prorocentrum cordatum]
MAFGCNPDSRISLSRDMAHCHCSPFSHALITALQMDDVGLHLRSRHLAEQRQGRFPLPALLARAGPGAVDCRNPAPSCISHLTEQRQSLFPLPALLARAGPVAVYTTSGSSLASRIAPSSASAHSHCPETFSHAL